MVCWYFLACFLGSKKQLIHLFSEQNDNKVNHVKSLFLDLKIQDHTENLINDYYKQAMIHLNAIDSDKKEPLIEFAEKTKERIS